MKNNKMVLASLVGGLLLTTVLGTPNVLAEKDSTNVSSSTTEETTKKVEVNSADLFKTPTLVYGGGLNETQQKEVFEDLKVTDKDFTPETTLGEDVTKYLKIPNSSTSGLFSSVYIKRSDREGQNKVKVLTKDNITLVTESGYLTPLVTAGVSNLEVRVASPDSAGKVSGESALTGLYKALDLQGAELNEDKVEVAQEELSTTAGILDSKCDKDLSYEDKEKLDTQLASALTEIKTQLAEIKDKQVSEKQVKEIVNEAVKRAGIESQLDDQDIDNMVKLANLYVDKKDSVLDKESIERYKDYANKIAGDLQDKWNQATQEDGWISKTWTNVKEFFNNLFSSKE